MSKKKDKKVVFLTIFFVLIFLIFFLVVFKIIDKKIDDRKREKEVENSMVIENEDIVQKEMSFEEAVKRLNTSSSLVNFLNSNISIENIFDSYIARKPEEVFYNKVANEVDIAVFSAYVLKENGIYGGVIRYDYKNSEGNKESNFVAVFREGDTPYYIILDDRVRLLKHGWSFNDLIKTEEERLKISIDRFAYFPVGQLDLNEPQYPYEWSEVN